MEFKPKPNSEFNFKFIEHVGHFKKVKFQNFNSFLILQKKDQHDQQSKKISALIKEVEALKKKRDWLFTERDKVLKERESIRGLCDDLRHQRDKSISELAEALRQVDEIQKQNASAYNQIMKLE